MGDIDMFPDELAASQAAEIERLKNEIKALQNICQKLNMIYHSAWEISEKVCCDGEYTLRTDEEVFVRLWSRMYAYDDHQDLRERFEYGEED